MSTVLEDRIRHAVEELPVAAPDLDRVRRRGRRLRRRRTGGTTLAAAVVTGVVAAGAIVVTGPGEQGPDRGELYASVGPLDATHGLRAYAAPAAELHLGGRTFPIEDMGYLDTDATTTSQGVVFFDEDNRPRMLDLAGEVVTLGPEPPSMAGDWHPSAKADSGAPVVALTQPARGGVQVQMVDVAQREVLATREVPCSGKDCGQVVVDALDDGVAWIRTPEGTRMWDGADTWALVSGPRTRIADVRNRVVLYEESTPAPELPAGWRAVPGAIDAQLTFDGQHVLYWSSTLAATTPGTAPIVLDQGPTAQDEGLAWWNVDTDGSILVAVAESSRAATQRPVSVVYDCELPSGSCTELGELTTLHGDPMFIGNDM